MPIDFFKGKCQKQTNEALFGLCDKTPPPHLPATVDFDAKNRKKWIAEVTNENEYEVTFTAIDNCIKIKRGGGNDDENRCDCMLIYEDNIIFVELKSSKLKNSKWIPKGEKQLRITISIFDQTHGLSTYIIKRAYLANNLRPNFQYSQQKRMDKFTNEMGVRLFIQNAIEL